MLESCSGGVLADDGQDWLPAGAHSYMGSAAPIQWPGGKGRMTGVLTPLLPRGEVYVEPYGGAGSMLFACSRYPCEVYNDLYGQVVNLYRVMQSPESFALLRRRLLSTLYSRAEFQKALEILATPDADSIDSAWALFVTQNQGFGGKAETAGDWGRVFVSSQGIAKNASKWNNRLNSLERYHRRLMGVQIDNRDALEVIGYWDSPDTVFYLDPPYPSATRITQGIYKHEAADSHHGALVELLLTLKGKVMLSGYATPIYDPLDASGWQRMDLSAQCSMAGRGRGSLLRGNGNASESGARTECVWLSPGASAQGDMFGHLGP